MSEILKRSEVDICNTWALEDIYASDDLWEAEVKTFLELCDKLSSYEGHLADSADSLFNYLCDSEKAEKLLERIYIYANQASHVDMNNSTYQGFAARANSYMVTLNSKTAFFTPEILSSDESIIRNYIETKPELNIYKTMFDRIFREKEHTLSKNEEALLANVNELASSPMDIYSLFTNADLTFEKIHDDKGELTDMTISRYVPFLNSTDRNVRKEAFMSMYKSFGQFKNTLAATYSANAKKATFFANARKRRINHFKQIFG